LPRRPGVSNIKPVRLAKGVVPLPRNVVGFAKSLRTHVVVKPGYRKGTFAT
jgi:hypothetical protein